MNYLDHTADALIHVLMSGGKTLNDIRKENNKKNMLKFESDSVGITKIFLDGEKIFDRNKDVAIKVEVHLLENLDQKINGLQDMVLKLKNEIKILSNTVNKRDVNIITKKIKTPNFYIPIFLDSDKRRQFKWREYEDNGVWIITSNELYKIIRENDFYYVVFDAIGKFKYNINGFYDLIGQFNIASFSLENVKQYCLDHFYKQYAEWEKQTDGVGGIYYKNKIGDITYAIIDPSNFSSYVLRFSNNDIDYNDIPNVSTGSLACAKELCMEHFIENF